MAVDAKELERLVDWENGLISPRIFADSDIYEAETERLFGRTWLFLAHESMLKKPGDFFSTFMGADPVLVVRQKDGSVNAFLNACRHRGMKVCRADAGNLKAFTCTYHGWSYDISGRLVNVPNLADGYYGELNMEKWGLTPVAQVDSYKGLIFGCFDPSAPPLLEYLGDSTFYLDNFLDRREGGTEVIGGVHKWTFKGNWKLAAEQFAGDAYHVGLSHSSVFMSVLEGPVAAAMSDAGALSAFIMDGRQYASRLGHGCGFGVGAAGAQLYPTPVLAKYFEDHRPEMERRLGHPPLGFHQTIFPNFSSLMPEPFSTIRVWHPKGPNAFETWSWILVDKAAPAEVKEETRRFSISQFSPAGMTEQDDGENWGEIGRNFTTSPQVRRHPLNYQMGLGHERDDDPEYPGRILHRGVGDAPQRGFYRRWLEYLTSESWPSVGSKETAKQLQGAARS